MNECSILWCGKYQQNWETTPHTHSFFQLILVAKGEGHVPLANTDYEVTAGDAVLIRPEESHAVICCPNDLLKLLDIKFMINDPDLFESVNNLPNFLKLHDFSWYSHCFENILRESQQQNLYYYPLICSYLYELLVHLLREQNSCEAPSSASLLPVDMTPVQQYKGVDVAALMQYIYFNYGNIITLDHLAEAAKINKTTLISLFKELYGTTPIRFINGLRMQKAKELLSHTDTGISEIAELVGFQSIHYFCRYFKSKENCTPLEFRMRNSKSRFFSFQ